MSDTNRDYAFLDSQTNAPAATDANSDRFSLKTSYIVLGVVAAAVSAATVAYVFWSRARRDGASGESVQQLLDKCHDQVRSIEQRLGALSDLNDMSNSATAGA